MIADIWEEFLDIVRQEAGSRVVETWFKAVVLLRWDAAEQMVYLQAPNAFVCNWLETKYTLLIQTHLARLLHVQELKVTFRVGDKPEEPTVMPKEVHLPVVSAMPMVPVSVPSVSNGYINKQYHFENFVVGPSNSLAYAAAQAISENPGIVYNPLFIYGWTGLGKTHLLHAIGNAIKQRNHKTAVLYQTADRFVNEFISAIRFDKVHKFKSKYQNIDVLLIDDIQFISNKEQTQEAFFHIFNTLYESHKQIVFSSDTFPQHMQGIAERLRSRLAWGLVADIHIPPLETKIVILKKKAHASNEILSDEVAHFIASRVVSNIRELEGALIRVIAFSALTKQPITLALAQKVLDRTQEQQKRAVDFEKIITCILKYHNCSLDSLNLISFRRA